MMYRQTVTDTATSSTTKPKPEIRAVWPTVRVSYTQTSNDSTTATTTKPLIQRHQHADRRNSDHSTTTETGYSDGAASPTDTASLHRHANGQRLCRHVHAGSSGSANSTQWRPRPTRRRGRTIVLSHVISSTQSYTDTGDSATEPLRKLALNPTHDQHATSSTSSTNDTYTEPKVRATAYRRTRLMETTRSRKREERTHSLRIMGPPAATATRSAKRHEQFHSDASHGQHRPSLL